MQVELGREFQHHAVTDVGRDIEHIAAFAELT